MTEPSGATFDDRIPGLIQAHPAAGRRPTLMHAALDHTGVTRSKGTGPVTEGGYGSQLAPRAARCAEATEARPVTGKWHAWFADRRRDGRRPVTAHYQRHYFDKRIPRPSRRAGVTGRRPVRPRPTGRRTRPDRGSLQSRASCRLASAKARDKLRRPHAVCKVRVGRRPGTRRGPFARSPQSTIDD